MAADYILFPDRGRPEYDCFMNASHHPFRLGGSRWLTADHYLLAMKFTGTPVEDRIRRCRSMQSVYALARDYRREERPDWADVRLRMTRRAVAAKFRTHADIRAVLLATGRTSLIVRPAHVTLMPNGTSRSDNVLGCALMHARSLLRRWEADQERGAGADREAVAGLSGATDG